MMDAVALLLKLDSFSFSVSSSSFSFSNNALNKTTVRSDCRETFNFFCGAAESVNCFWLESESATVGQQFLILLFQLRIVYVSNIKDFDIKTGLIIEWVKFCKISDARVGDKNISNNGVTHFFNTLDSPTLISMIFWKLKSKKLNIF